MEPGCRVTGQLALALSPCPNLVRRAIPVDTPPDRPSARADPAARYPDLWAALQRLPDKQRLAVAYHHVAGLPFAEIAELLGNSPDAARRAAADGLKTLRKHYREDETA